MVATSESPLFPSATDPAKTMTHAVTLIPRNLRPADAIDSNHHPTRARHPNHPTRTASWPPSDSANRTINTLDSSANPSIVCLPSPVYPGLV